MNHESFVALLLYESTKYFKVQMLHEQYFDPNKPNHCFNLELAAWWKCKPGFNPISKYSLPPHLNIIWWPCKPYYHSKTYPQMTTC